MPIFRQTTSANRPRWYGAGQVTTGVRISESEATLSLGDETGKRHDIPKSDIEERTVQRQSTMPKGLEKRLTDRELLDLLAYLVSVRKSPP